MSGIGAEQGFSTPQTNRRNTPTEPLVRLLYGLDLHAIVNQHFNCFRISSISTLTERRIDNFYLDLRDYAALVFNGDSEEVSLNWNCVGATLSYRDETHNIFIRLWERSEGHLNLPDMTMIVETVVFDRKIGTRHNPDVTDSLRKEMKTFSKWIILTARICCFKYIADPSTPPIPKANIPSCPIACLPLK